MVVCQHPATVVFKLCCMEEGGHKVYEYALKKSISSEGNIRWDGMQKRKASIWAEFTHFWYISVWFSNWLYFPSFSSWINEIEEIIFIYCKLHSLAMQELNILLLYTELQLLSHLALS